MEYRRLGTTGLTISPLVLGSASFGELIDEDATTAVIHEALDLGINAIDVGDVYAAGLGEEIIGRAVKGRRDSVVLCTKVGLRVGEDPAANYARSRAIPGAVPESVAPGREAGPAHHTVPNCEGLSRVHIVRAVEDSLRRFGTDYIDLYQVHLFDPETPLEETVAVLDDLVTVGKVRYVGCSAFAGWQLVRALWIADVGRRNRFSSVQVRINLCQREAERELLPACAALGVGALAFQTLAGGVLTDAYDSSRPPPPGTRIASRPGHVERYWTPEVFGLAHALRSFGEATGRAPGEAAVGWALARPGVAAAIVGAETPEHVREIAAIGERPLAVDELALLESLVSVAG